LQLLNTYQKHNKPVQLKKKILVAPLSRGLGHAARCIPIIEALENHGYEPIIASDGVALAFLKKEFPLLTALELPSYQIEYARKGAFFKLKLLLQLPKMFYTVRSENKMVCSIVKEYELSGIISDNRLGAFCNSVPSVFITHQLNVLTGSTTMLTSKIHAYFIKKFRECWVPDVQGNPNLSGKLGHTENNSLNLKYIGPLSRLHKQAAEKKYDLMVLLSGPEPLRSQIEEKLLPELKKYNGKTIVINGIIEDEQKIIKNGNTLFYNYMTTPQLEQAFAESELVLCRPGYTTIMDLAKLCKKAFFVVPRGEYEQEYLAKKLKRSNTVPFAALDNFKLKNLAKADMYKGLKNTECNIKWKDLFSLFEGK
jgi:uncharacterized protein (TIGR00661 family)